MQEYELKILDRYALNVKSTRRVRGAFFCEAEEGLFLLKEAGISEKRADALYKLGEMLIAAGYRGIDQLKPNVEGGLVTVSEEGGRYLVKRWFSARECDARRTRELMMGAKNLARLHLLMREPTDGVTMQDESLKQIYERHNRELRKVRSFVRSRRTKDEFELRFLQEYEGLYQWAEIAMEVLLESRCEELYQDSLRERVMIHGEYNYHNILICTDGIATTNFEKFRIHVQMEDFYYYLRKTMEKHEWDARLFDHMMNAYSAICPVTDREMEYLKARFIYPEKFWKIAGSYYKSNKAWTSVKNVEKFQMSVSQMREKEKLLEEIFGFHR